MTLHEAAAVYLIIGGVLLGPIERPLLPGLIEQARTECKDAEHWALCLSMKEHELKAWWPRETTAETCERAMREIGAEHVTDYTKNDPRGARLLSGQSSDDLSEHIDSAKSGWFVEGQRVLCIPAPSGLKR